MDKEEPVFQHINEDEIGESLKELNASVQRGDVLSLAVRLYRKDGTYKDLVAGYKTEEERLAMLADLERQIKTKSN